MVDVMVPFKAIIEAFVLGVKVGLLVVYLPCWIISRKDITRELSKHFKLMFAW